MDKGASENVIWSSPLFKKYIKQNQQTNKNQPHLSFVAPLSVMQNCNKSTSILRASLIAVGDHIMVTQKLMVPWAWKRSPSAVAPAHQN